MTRPVALDLFAGVGMWSLGLRRAGIHTVAACEIDPWRRSVFAMRFPGVRLYEDIRELTGERLHGDGIVADLVVGSPPCQDASAANTKGIGLDGSRTALFWQALRLVREVRPAWICFENSPRLRTRGVDRLLAELESLDYAVWPLVVSAGDIGAPHERKRLWIVGHDSHADRNGERARLAGRQGSDAAGQRRDGWRSAEAPGWPRAEPSGDDRRDGLDADGHGVRQQSRRRSGQDGADQAVAVANDPDADRARQQIGQGGSQDVGAQLPPALGTWARAWPDWHDGISGLEAAHLAARDRDLGDGFSARLVSRRRNSIISAVGDAILPQIAEAIGRAIGAAAKRQADARAGQEPLL